MHKKTPNPIGGGVFILPKTSIDKGLSVKYNKHSVYFGMNKYE